MKNSFFRIIDGIICKTEYVARWCKRINGKILGAGFAFVLCCLAVSFWGENALGNFPIIKSAYYDTLAANCPDVIASLSNISGRIILIIIFSLILLCYVVRRVHRPLALLMLHSTMGHDLSKLSKSLKDAFWFKRAKISIDIPSQNISEEQIIGAVCEQDMLFKDVQTNSWYSTVFYCGVAHTPLVFRFGYQWGQTKEIRLLHRFRPTEGAQEFKELPEYVEEKMSYIHSDRLDELNFNLQSKHLLVSIATTYPIKDEDLARIDTSNTMSRYNMQVDAMGFDFFNSYHKIHSYADRIIDDLRKIVKDRGIEVIHFAISSSVPFTFYLAQQMNTQQFSKIIVYHFDHGKYTWGIDVTEPDAEKAIRWAGSVDNATVV